MGADRARAASARAAPAPAVGGGEQLRARCEAQTGSPAVRITWIALKLDPSCARRPWPRARQRVVGRRSVCAGRRAPVEPAVRRRVRASVLTEEELVAAVATSACAGPMVTAQAGRSEAPQRRTEESGRSWRCDNRRHTTYCAAGPTGRADHPAVPQLVAQLTTVPALATTFSLTARPGRPAGRDDDRAHADHRPQRQRADDGQARPGRAARQVRTGLVRLDREQLPGVLATLPLGGAR
ncbi:type VII secretion protein EccE [Streptomyces sp. KL116D]|uniref:type VII secretion protein EccE n=1 Tax=Streptomyces sp. KL116D TaxID=3045152 RepID=UPI00355807FC